MDNSRKKVEVMAPAGNLASVKTALDAGADAVYLGFNDATNARNFEGLNFTPEDLEESARLIAEKGARLYVAINTFPQRDDARQWERSVDKAVSLNADALILADMGVLSYARDSYPDAELHLSVQASASSCESINFYKKHFGITRVVLPRVHTVEEIRTLKENTDVELEVFCLGGLCINIEGRCYLSSFVTGSSTNSEGACSPSRFVRFDTTEDGSLSISLNNVLLNKLGEGESSPYPTCCKGRYEMPGGNKGYAMEAPESLNALELLPELIEAGISALKIEGRQRTKSYVGAMTKVVREAVDSYYKDPANFKVRPEWWTGTTKAFEGSSLTLGPYGGK